MVGSKIFFLAKKLISTCSLYQVAGLTVHGRRRCCDAGLTVHGRRRCCDAGLTVHGRRRCCDAGLTVHGRRRCCDAGLTVHGRRRCCDAGLTVHGDDVVNSSRNLTVLSLLRNFLTKIRQSNR